MLELDDSGNCLDPDPCTTSGGSICNLSSDPSGCLSTYGGTDTVGTLSIGGTTSTEQYAEKLSKISVHKGVSLAWVKPPGA